MPPSNTIVATMEAKGVEQLQPTALDSEETTTTGTCAKGCVMVYMHVMTVSTQYIIMMMFVSQKL